MLSRLSQYLLGAPQPRTPCNRRIQIMSDLHLELNRQYATFDFAVTAPLLLLGGDIGRLVDYDMFLPFLARQTARYDKVFLVLGNHEFYEMTFEAGLERAMELEREPSLEGKLKVLHRERWDDEGSALTILGATLWSRIDEKMADTITLRVSDFKQIKGWSVAKHNANHALDLTYLTTTLAALSTSNRTVLIATHHAPVTKGSSRPEHEDKPWKTAFGTDVLTKWGAAEFRDVACWVFGHTHFTTEFERAGVRVVANQRGYVLGYRGPTLEDTRGFDAERVVEL